jgi:predicted secreted Zn-dependent protease
MIIPNQATGLRVSSLLIVFAALSAGSPCTAIAEPVLKQTTATYDIRGTSIRELKAAMREHGPSSTGSNSTDRNIIIVGQTSTTFSWSFQSVKERDGCFPRNITITLEARVLIPLWTDKLLATYPLQDEWDRYRVDVERHEQRHVEIAYDSARELERGLAAARSEKCEDLKTAMRAIADGHLEKNRQKQREFDAREGSCQLRRSCMKGASVPAIRELAAVIHSRLGLIAT